MQKKSLLFLLFFLLSCFCVGAPPVPFSGKLAVGGKNFHGNALFAFSLVDDEGVVHWKHGQENNATIENFVLNGRYLVLLGGQGMQSLPANLFLENDNLFLRVRVDLQDGQGIRLLEPDQPITSTPYALAAELARLAEKAEIAGGVDEGAITADMIDTELLADLNKTITISDLPEEVVESMNRPITREMLPQDVRDDLNRTIGVAQLSAEVNEKLNRDFTIQPGSISKSLLGQDVLGDLNRTILRHHLSEELRAELNRTIRFRDLAPEVIADLNDTIAPGSISLDMLASGVRADLNRTISKSMLSQEIKDDLNRTIGVAQLSAEVNEKLNRDFTIQPGSISKSLLGQDVLGDLNRTILRHHLSEELRAELNRTIRLRDLAPEVIADLNDSIAPGSITLDMLASGVRADLNRTVRLQDLSPEVSQSINRSITLSDLDSQVITELNNSIAPGSISLDQLSQQVRSDLNRTITKSMLAEDIKNDLNRTITLGDLAPEVIADLNDSIQQGSITLDLLSSQVRNDLNRTITKSMLSQEVLNELNSSSGGGGVMPGSLLAVPANQSAPSGYSLYEEAEPKYLVWEEKAPVSVARYASDGVEALDGKIYFVGGYTDSSNYDITERYDPLSNTWENLANMSAARAGVACAVLNGKLYAIGGVGLSSVEVFDPSNGTWSAGIALPSEVNRGPAITVDGNIYLIGGRNASSQRINQVLSFDPSISQWSTKANMPTAREAIKPVWFENRIWAIGGYDGSPLNLVESYDPTTDTWQVEASLTIARSWPVAWVANGRIYAGGGYQGSFLNSIEVYDPMTKQWTSAGNFLENKHAADAVVLNDKAYVVAGATASGVYSNKVFAADLNASVSGVFDLYRKDGNASSGVPTVQAEVADGSVTVSKLSSEVSNALKPVVISQPNSVVSANGGSTYLSVGATGGGNTYQWKKNGVDISGANSSTLSITDLNASQHEGNYTVVVSNAFGSVTSSVAQVDFNGSLTEGLVGWWKFDETNGTIASDSSGNGNDGNLTNGPTWTEGKIGGALRFNGIDNYVLVPGTSDFDISYPSISAWVYSDNFNQLGFIFEKTSDGNLNTQYSLFLGYGNLNFRAKPLDSGYSDLTVSHSNLRLWSFIFAVYDGQNRKIYVNGDLLSKSPWSETITTNPGGISLIGAYAQNSVGQNYFFNGLIDDLRIYDRALSAVEVKALYELGEEPVQESGFGTTTMVNGTVADGSITTNQLSEQILKYLKPEITQQPTATTIFADTNHTISVSAEGKYLTYQWKKNGTTLAGETNATLTITDANATQHEGNYTVVVSNDFGSVESGQADMDVWNVGDDISNVSLWLDASNFGSFELSNSVIQNWRDLSGNGNDMNISNGNPSLTGQLHGKTVAAYDGDDTTATTKNFSNDLDQSGYSIVALSRYAGNPRFRVISSGYSGSLRNWLLGHHGGKHSTFFAENWVDQGTTGDLNWHIFSVTHEPAISYNNGVAPLSSFWLDGTNRAQNSGASSDTAPSPSDIVFGGVGEEKSNCEVAEFIMIAAEISDSKRLEIEGYLAHKWGLRSILPNNHFYK